MRHAARVKNTASKGGTNEFSPSTQSPAEMQHRKHVVSRTRFARHPVPPHTTCSSEMEKQPLSPNPAPEIFLPSQTSLVQQMQSLTTLIEEGSGGRNAQGALCVPLTRTCFWNTPLLVQSTHRPPGGSGCSLRLREWSRFTGVSTGTTHQHGTTSTEQDRCHNDILKARAAR